MKVSVVMASYLGQYRKAARNRDKKIVRAIDSVLNQSHKDVELIVVADGCQKTVEILKANYTGDPRVKGYLIPKQSLWSGVPRNTGIEKAEGEWICYLDVDDYLGENHIKGIVDNIKPGDDWLFFDDLVISKDAKKTTVRYCSMNMGKCGTSNIIHKKIAKWDERGSYAHDWRFIKNLQRASRNYRRVVAGEYVVCHIPGRVDA